MAKVGHDWLTGTDGSIRWLLYITTVTVRKQENRHTPAQAPFAFCIGINHNDHKWLSGKGKQDGAASTYSIEPLYKGKLRAISRPLLR